MANSRLLLGPERAPTRSRAERQPRRQILPRINLQTRYSSVHVLRGRHSERVPENKEARREVQNGANKDNRLNNSPVGRYRRQLDSDNPAHLANIRTVSPGSSLPRVSNSFVKLTRLSSRPWIIHDGVVLELDYVLSKQNDSRNQIVGDRLVGREFEISLRTLVFGYFILEFSGCRWVEPDVSSERSKMDDVDTVQLEGRDLIADCFLGLGCCSPNCLPHSFQNSLDIFRTGLDVFVNCLKLLFRLYCFPSRRAFGDQVYPIRMPKTCPTTVPIMKSARLAARIIPDISPNWRMKRRPEITVS